MTRKRKRRRGRGGRILLLLLLLLLGRLWLDNCTVRTTEYDIRSDRIPAAFEGMRIAQISDLHGSERLYGALLRQVKEASPEIIVLTGDLTDAEEQWPALAELLHALTEIAPCCYVSGNHEWADLEPEPLFRRIEETGVTLLRNRWVTLEKGGSQIVLLGVEDPNGYADMTPPDELCALLRSELPEDYVIALCHRPGLFPTLAAGGCGLVLSGHHHGGLIRLPFLGGLISPSGPLPEYDAGLFTLGDSVMLVSPGLAGVKGLPRFLNRPEVSVAVLHGAA